MVIIESGCTLPFLVVNTHMGASLLNSRRKASESDYMADLYHELVVQ